MNERIIAKKYRILLIIANNLNYHNGVFRKDLIPLSGYSARTLDRYLKEIEKEDYISKLILNGEELLIRLTKEGIKLVKCVKEMTSIL